MAKRTIEEVYILLNKKRENAIRDRDRKRNDLSNSKEWRDNESIRLYGEIEAYTDVIILLETSGLIKPEDNEEDKEAFLK